VSRILLIYDALRPRYIRGYWIIKD